MKQWNRWQQLIDIKGGVWAGIFTFIVLMKLILICFWSSPDFTSGVLTVYGTIIGTFGLTKLGAKAINGNNGHKVEIE